MCPAQNILAGNYWGDPEPWGVLRVVDEWYTTSEKWVHFGSFTFWDYYEFVYFMYRLLYFYTYRNVFFSLLYVIKYFIYYLVNGLIFSYYWIVLKLLFDCTRFEKYFLCSFISNFITIISVLLDYYENYLCKNTSSQIDSLDRKILITHIPKSYSFILYWWPS